MLADRRQRYRIVAPGHTAFAAEAGPSGYMRENSTINLGVKSADKWSSCAISAERPGNTEETEL